MSPHPAPALPAPARGATPARLELAAATRADLAAVRAHVVGTCAAWCGDAAAGEALALAVDEVCANVVTHGYGGGAGPLTVEAGGEAGRCWARVTDAAPAFDPTAAPSARRAPPMPARGTGDACSLPPPGGLGWPLVRRSVHTLVYERAGGHNVLALVRRCAAPSAARPCAFPLATPMEISIVHEQDVTVVAAAGSLDALTADALDDALQAQLRGGRARLVASLGGLEYTSSAGLRVLLAGARGARQRGGDLRVAGARGGVERVLALSGFTGILRCYPDVPSAVASWPA